MSELFEEPPNVVVTGLCPSNMPVHRYSISSDRPLYSYQRKFWNSVFNNCDLEDFKREIYSNVHSDRPEQFVAALFELFMHEFLRRLKFTVEAGAPLLHGKPDFKVMDQAGKAFILEVTCDFGQALKGAEQKREDDLIAIINSTVSEHFRVALRLEGSCSVNPKLSKFECEYKQWFDQLDYATLLRKQQLSSWRYNPEKCFDLNDLQIFVQPIALPTPRSSHGGGMIASQIFGSVGVDTGARISSKLKEKADQTRGADLPVMIAINEIGDFLQENDILEGMRNYWKQGDKLRNQHVEGVLFFNKVGFSAEPYRQPFIVINHCLSSVRVPLDLPCITYFRMSEDEASLQSMSRIDDKSNRYLSSLWPFDISEPRPAGRSGLGLT